MLLGGSPVHCGIFSSVPGLYPLEVETILPQGFVLPLPQI